MQDRPSEPTAYEVLGVPRTATPAEVRTAYRRLVRRAHPDVGGSAEDFHRVALAWERLGTTSARARYDAAILSTSAEAPHPAWAAGAADPAAAAGGPSTGGWTSTDDAARQARSRGRGTLARSFGHPGGSVRQHYLDLLRARLADPVPPTPPSRAFVYDGPPPLAWTPGPYVRRAVWLAPAIAGAVALGWRAAAGLTDGETASDALLAGLLLAAVAVVAGLALAWPIGMLAFGAQARRRRSVHRSAEDALRHERDLRSYPGHLRRYQEQVARLRPVRDRVLSAPYAVQSMPDVPADIRLWLDRAQAEEATARELAKLGADFTIWSDVAIPGTPDRVDSLVLGFQGLFVVDTGSAGGASDRVADGLSPETVSDALKKRVRVLSRALGTGIAAIVLVVDDDDDAGGRDSSAARLVRGGSLPTFVIARSRLAAVLGAGLPEMERGTRDEVFATRSKLVGSVPFV